MKSIPALSAGKLPRLGNTKTVKMAAILSLGESWFNFPDWLFYLCLLGPGLIDHAGICHIAYFFESNVDIATKNKHDVDIREPGTFFAWGARILACCCKMFSGFSTASIIGSAAVFWE